MVSIIKVYATITYRNGTERDAAAVAQWVGEALGNPDIMDSHCTYVVHSVEVEHHDQ